MPERYSTVGESEAVYLRRERATKDVWARTLAQIPNLFAKIVYLVSLRNQNTGKYQHFGLSQIYSSKDADLALRESHEELFREWLKLPLEPQKRNLEEYFQSLDEDLDTVIGTWLTLAPYQQFFPVRATVAERELYVSDLELVLELLRGDRSDSQLSARRQPRAALRFWRRGR